MRWLLALSLCVNAALIVAITLVFQRDHVAPAASESSAGRLRVDDPEAPPRREVERRIVYVTNRFEWRYLASTNYFEYASNLRAVGCPEQTVRDILEPELEQEFERRRRAIDHAVPFWTGGRARRIMEQTNRIALAALVREYELLFKTLLDVGWCPGFKGPFGEGSLAGQAVIRFLFGPMPDERLRRVAVTFEKFDQLEQELRNRNGGTETEEEERERRLIGLRVTRELESILTPIEWEEMRARLGMIDQVEEVEDMAFQSVGLSPAELRGVCLAWWDTCGHFDQIGTFEDWRTEEERLRAGIEFTNRVAALLSPEQFHGYVRARDPQFRQLWGFTSERQLPDSAAIGVYELRRYAAEETQRLQADETLPEESRRREIAEMRLNVRAQVEAVLGEEAYADYLNHGGAWVTNQVGL